ncbi:MAG: hypothetical protein ACYCR7_05715 [Thermoplasmataceae archaeon]
MKNRDKELNLMEIDVKLSDFAEVIAGVAFIISVIGIISGSLSSSSVNAVQSQSNTASAGFTVAPQYVKGPGGSGPCCKVTTYTGGLKYSQVCTDSPNEFYITSLTDCAELAIEEAMKTEISATGKYSKTLSTPNEQTHLKISGGCWPFEQTGASSSSGSVTVKSPDCCDGISGTKFVWTVSFTNAENGGLTSTTTTINFIEIIGLKNGEMAAAGEALVGGSYLLNWNSILMTIIKVSLNAIAGS